MKELNEITEQDFIEYVSIIKENKITSIAPLGCSGDDLIIYENKNKPLKKEFISKEEYENSKNSKYCNQEYYDKPASRSSQLSFRKYGDECEILITDISGNFLTYSKLNLAFPIEFIAKYFYELFIQLKPYMNKLIDKIEIEFDKNAKTTIGFLMFEAYAKEVLEENK